MVVEVDTNVGGKGSSSGSSSSSAGVVAVPKALEKALEEETPTTTATGGKAGTGTATTQQSTTSSKKKKKGQQQQQPQGTGTAGSSTNKENAKTVVSAAPPAEDNSNKTDKKEAAVTTTTTTTTNNAVKPMQASSPTRKPSPPPPQLQQPQQPQQQQQQQQQLQPQQAPQRLLPFQPYAGIPPFNQLRDSNLQDWPPGRGLTFIRPCPSGTSSLEKLGMLKNCPQILAYIQSFSGADWMEATFSPQPCIRLTATTQMPGGRATAEAILRLSDEMILQWLHRFDPQMPIWAMFVCPAMLSGLMVGKQAVNVKKIEESSTARVWAAPRDLEAQYVSFFICSNNYDATREAYAMLESRAHNQMEMALTTNIQQQHSMPAQKAPAAPIRIQKPVSSSSPSSGGSEKKVVLTPVSTPSSSISSCSDDEASSTDTEPSTQQPTRESTPPATHPTSKPVPPSSSSSSSSSSSLASTTTTKGSDSDSSSSSSSRSRSSGGNLKVGVVTRSLSGGTGKKANHQSASPTKEKVEEK